MGRIAERYEDFGPTLIQEKLEAEGYEIDHETVRAVDDRPRKSIGAGRLDESLHFVFCEQELRWQELPSRPQPPARKKTKKKAAAIVIMEKYVPPPDHPWRRSICPGGVSLQRL